MSEALVFIRVEKHLVEKAIKKLKANPDTPATYIVDQVLRNFVEE